MASITQLRRVNTVSGDFTLPRPGFPAGLRCLVLDLTGEDQTCAAQLRQCAYEVTCASSVEAALAALAGASYDVLLAEGTALTSKAPEADKLREFIKELPTIMICECPKPEEVMQSIKLGVVEVLERPLCPLKLKNIWQHTVRRIMRSASQQVLHTQQAQQQQQPRGKALAAGRRSSQELCAQANSQNGSSTAPELSFCPVTPAATTGNTPNNNDGSAKATGRASNDSSNNNSGNPHDLAFKPSSPRSCGATPTFHPASAATRKKTGNGSSSNNNNGSSNYDLTTATSSLINAPPPAVNVLDSALYAPAPSTPMPAAGNLLRAGSNSGNLAAGPEEAALARAGSARVLGVKRKSKDMARAATDSGGMLDGASPSQQGQQQQQQEQHDAHLPPARRGSIALDNPQQQEQQGPAADAPVVSGDDLMMAPFGSLVDEFMAATAATTAPAAPQPPAAQIHLAPAGSSALDAAAAGSPNGLAWPSPANAAAAHHAIGPAVGLPVGMTWGMALNPSAVAPGITPPIFPAPCGPVMPHPLAPSLWPSAPGMPPPPTPGCPVPPGAMLPPPAAMFHPMMGMMQHHQAFNPAAAMCMPGAFGGNPMMAAMMGGAPGAAAAPQLPALPMSMLMGACGGGQMPDASQMQQAGGFCGGFGGHPGCMPGMHASPHQGMAQGMGPQGMMGSPCSPTPTDPSIMNSSHLSEHSVQDMLGLGFEAAQQQQQQQLRQQHGMGGKATMNLGGKGMGRCESHQLLPSLLDDLMADADADMDLELDALSLTADLTATTTGAPQPPPPAPPASCGPRQAASMGGRSGGGGLGSQLQQLMRRNDSLDDLIGSAVAAF